jgi:hypothetical protein
MIGQSVSVAIRATTGRFSLRTTARAVMLRTVSAACDIALTRVDVSNVHLSPPAAGKYIHY